MDRTINLCRRGDFYEAFHQDARVLADTLGVTLTSRCGVPMAAIPVHSLSDHVDKLCASGLYVKFSPVF